VAQARKRCSRKSFPGHHHSRASRFQVITTLAQIGGGLALLIGIYFTYGNLEAAREGQITDRFIRAVDQLGATDKDGEPAREIRLGGVYAMWRIARDSPEDYKPIREILNDYVRRNAPWPPRATKVQPEVDIQAALDFLGNPIQKFEKVTPTVVKLSRTDLRGAILNEAHLEKAQLEGAHLERAQLTAAHLEGADLRNARLDDAHLPTAYLESACLTGAHLKGAQFSVTPMPGLTQGQVDCAYRDGRTILPLDIDPVNWWGQPGGTPPTDCECGPHASADPILGEQFLVVPALLLCAANGMVN
jgi:hypothetical protein